MSLFDYVAEEIADDHADGLMSRREAVRKLMLMGFTAASAGTLLATVPAAAAAAAGTTKKTSRRTTTTKRRTATTKAPPTTAATTTAAPTTAATTTAAPTTAAATNTVPASTSSGTAAGPSTTPAEAIRFPGPAGELQGTYAAPAQPKGAVLIIHENRGLTDHFRAFPNRFAADGYAALAIDLASRKGGTAAVADQMPAPLTSISTADLVADAKAALSELAKRAPGRKLAVIGFCFGGGMVWSLLASGEPRLAAAAPFYGPGPDGADFAGSKGAAVLGVYAELDARVNASRDPMKAALDKAGNISEIRTFPGVDHAFFNDTGARYNAPQATEAYKAVLAWFGKHLA